ncbi:MAG: GFA family protein [Cocleimonas sp.]|nr:GFA family protein [Cocleimonas sp.]
MDNENSQLPYTGQCLCGLIQYAVDKIESQMGHCHCSMCRKFHGAAFSTFAEAQVANFHWLKGKKHLKTYLAPNGTQRKFCEQCGSSLIFVPANDTREIIEFSLGTLDSDTPIKPDAHVFTDYRAHWYEITDPLPQFKENRKT